MTGCIEFRDDDSGYLAWLAANQQGHVINIARSHNTSQARLHAASCRTIGNRTPMGSSWTGPYVKVCAEFRADVEQWAVETVGQSIDPCGTCCPSGVGARSAATRPAESPLRAQVMTARYEIHGPTESTPVVEAWADDYIRFELGPQWQKDLRNEIRARCSELNPSSEQVLHATFFGAKASNADVENLMLYNIGSFKGAGRNGIRFEHGQGVPSARSGGTYPISYRYALAQCSGTFDHWRSTRTLASFDWIDLGEFAGEKKLSQVWLALSRGQIDLADRACPQDAPFAVEIDLRPPVGREPIMGNLVKGVFDGVISAFQAHTDTSVLPDAAARVASLISAEPAEIENHLLDQRRAVLGVSPRLVSPYRDGVKWDPADHRCVAGELLATEPVGPRWAIRGRVVEVDR
ncbi:hypothetical protein JCM12141A_36850 [Mycolicibacterium hodleri]